MSDEEKTVSSQTANYRYETLHVHAGREPAPGTNAPAVPDTFLKEQLQIRALLAAAPAEECRHD